jgi:hypothetical protein
MQPEQFSIYSDELLEHRSEVKGRKSNDYSFDNDRLWNLKVVAFLLEQWVETTKGREITPADSALVLSFKHIARLILLVGQSKISLGEAMETTGDIQNYVDLIYAEIRERMDMGIL